MSDEARTRFSLVLALGAAAVAAGSALEGDWWIVGAMVLVIVGQVLNLRAIRRRREQE